MVVFENSQAAGDRGGQSRQNSTAIPETVEMNLLYWPVGGFCLHQPGSGDGRHFGSRILRFADLRQRTRAADGQLHFPDGSMRRGKRGPTTSWTFLLWLPCRNRL